MLRPICYFIAKEFPLIERAVFFPHDSHKKDFYFYLIIFPPPWLNIPNPKIPLL